MIHPDDQREFEAMTDPIDGKYPAGLARLTLAVERLARVLAMLITQYRADDDG